MGLRRVKGIVKGNYSLVFIDICCSKILLCIFENAECHIK